MRGLPVGTRVRHCNYPMRHGTVTESPYGSNDVRVRWDDGRIGDLVWRHDVAYNAYLLEVVAAMRGQPKAEA